MTPANAVLLAAPAIAGLSACAYVDDTRPTDPASDRRIVTLQAEDGGAESDFDFAIRLARVPSNNDPLAGRSLALREARKLCGLDHAPSAEEVDLTLGMAIYTNREYFVRCPQPGKDAR